MTDGGAGQAGEAEFSGTTAAMPGAEGPLPLSDPRALSILTTEHFALQGARGATISGASGRAGLYLSALSGTLVALSLLGTATRLAWPFALVASIVTPT